MTYYINVTYFKNVINLKESSWGAIFSLYLNALTNFYFQFYVWFWTCWNLPSIVAPNVLNQQRLLQTLTYDFHNQCLSILYAGHFQGGKRGKKTPN